VGRTVSTRQRNTTKSQSKKTAPSAKRRVVVLVALVGVYLAPVLPVALVCTAVLSASHAVIAAAVVTLLVRRCGDVRGTALSLNAAGMSLGLFLGAAVAGAGLAVAGYAGAAVVLGALTVLAMGAAATLRPRDRDARS